MVPAKTKTKAMQRQRSIVHYGDGLRPDRKSPFFALTRPVDCSMMSTDVTETKETPLSVALRVGTKEAHRDAERSAFVKRLFAGTFDKDEFVQMLVDLRQVYAALETVLSCHASLPFIAPIYFPKELVRLAALDDDLEFYGVNKSHVVPTGAALAYAAHLQKLDPLLLISHAYVRYLGDLSGGQQLAARVRKALHLSEADGKGTRFYVFDQVDDLAQFKALFRQRLDSLTLTDDQAAGVVAEALRAFQLSASLFDAIDDINGGAPGTLKIKTAVASSSSSSSNEAPLTSLALSPSPSATPKQRLQSKAPSSALAGSRWPIIVAVLMALLAALSAFIVSL